MFLSVYSEHSTSIPAIVYSLGFAQSRLSAEDGVKGITWATLILQKVKRKNKKAYFKNVIIKIELIARWFFRSDVPGFDN